jgi:spermidine synthase
LPKAHLSSVITLIFISHGFLMNSQHSDKSSSLLSVFILLIFFISGFCALVYEVAWLKVLSLVFGVTSLATATTLASFMAGLGLGSYFLGRAADSVRRPLRLYGLLEIGIGVFAFLMPSIFSGLDVIYGFVYTNVTSSYLWLSVIRLVLSFTVLLIPTFFMGGTLPVITRYLVRKHEELGKKISQLYFINTLGAVCGALAAGFVLLYYLGVAESAYLAGAINLLIGFIFIFLDKRDTAQLVNEEQGRISKDAAASSDSDTRLILWVIGISGFCSLAYQVIWARSLVYILDNTAHAFTTMLVAFLLGLALGSLAVSRWLDKTKNPALILGVTEIGIGIFGMVSIPLFMNWGAGIGGGLSGELVFPTDNQTTWAFIRLLRSLSVMLLPTFLMGMTIPLATSIYSRAHAVIGDAVGKVYAVNTIGSVVGSFAAGLLLIPMLGVYGSSVFIGVINTVIGLSIILNHRFATSGNKIKVTALVTLPALVIFSFLISRGNITLSSIVESQFPTTLLFYKEGVAATVKVYEEAERKDDKVIVSKTISINGFPVAGTIASHVDGQKTLGNLPFLLSSVESPRVNIIGFGAGGSAWASTLYNTTVVDLVELVPDVINGARHIPEVNHGAMDSSKVNIIYDDGRNYLNRVQKTYDIISVDATSPKSAGSGSLYSLEFYKAAEKRLSDEGIMIQWMPYHLMTEADVKMIARTFQSVFPNATLWFSFTRHYYVMIGTKKELRINFERLNKLVSDSKVQGELNEVDSSDAYDVLAAFLMSADGLARYVGEGPLNTDNHPLLEYDPATIYLDSDKPVIANLNSTRNLREKSFQFLDVPPGSAESVRLALEERIAATPIESYWPQYMR